MKAEKFKYWSLESKQNENVSIQKRSGLVQIFLYWNRNIRFSPDCFYIETEKLDLVQIVSMSEKKYSDLVQMFCIETKMFRFSPDVSLPKQERSDLV